MNQETYIQNFRKSLEIIDTCFTLKEAYLKSQFPDASKIEIKEMIYKGILQRKEQQWKSQMNSSER